MHTNFISSLFFLRYMFYLIVLSFISFQLVFFLIFNLLFYVFSFLQLVYILSIHTFWTILYNALITVGIFTLFYTISSKLENFCRHQKCISIAPISVRAGHSTTPLFTLHRFPPLQFTVVAHFICLHFPSCEKTNEKKNSGTNSGEHRELQSTRFFLSFLRVVKIFEVFLAAKRVHKFFPPPTLLQSIDKEVVPQRPLAATRICGKHIHI